MLRTVLELASLILVIAGIALMNIPIAMIVAGLVIFVAVHSPIEDAE